MCDRTGPKTVDAAHRMLRHSFGLSEWALTVLGTVDDETVYHPDNVALYVAEVAAQVSVAHQRDVLWILGQIGRVVAARFWPRARLTLPKTGPALPYNLNEEEAFRLAATLRREPVRAASAAVVSLALGAGLLARDVQRVVVDDVVAMGDGRLAVWVDRNDPNARLVPVRSDYTDLLNHAIEDSCGQTVHHSDRQERCFWGGSTHRGSRFRDALSDQSAVNMAPSAPTSRHAFSCPSCDSRTAVVGHTHPTTRGRRPKR